MTTIREILKFKGIGLHSGKESSAVLYPYSKKGIFFKFGNKITKAEPENVCDTSRCTMLNIDDHTVQTCEHLLATIYALGIDSILIENSENEIPIFDGSGKIWYDSLVSSITGTKEKYATIKNPVRAEEKDAFIEAVPADHFEIDYHLDYAHPLIGKSDFHYTEDKFPEFVAPSRTYALFEEVEYLRSKGLAKGGNESNCIIILKDRLSVPLIHEKEFVTHKILDLLGDISLVGTHLNIKIKANKSGHRLNNIFARKLRTVIENA